MTAGRRETLRSRPRDVPADADLADQAGDQGLAEAFRAGDPGALEEAYRQWSPLVYTMTLRALRERTDAEDVTQEVFVRAWRSRGRFDPTRGQLIGLAGGDHAARDRRSARGTEPRPSAGRPARVRRGHVAGGAGQPRRRRGERRAPRRRTHPAHPCTADGDRAGLLPRSDARPDRRGNPVAARHREESRPAGVDGAERALARRRRLDGAARGSRCRILTRTTWRCWPSTRVSSTARRQQQCTSTWTAAPTAASSTTTCATIVLLGRTSLDPSAATLVAPPPSVWARVAADAGVQPTAGAPKEQAPRPARDPRWPRFVAGAVGVLVGAAATVAVALVVTSDDPQTPSPSAETPSSTAPGDDVLARTRLAALPGQQAQGDAVLAERGSTRLLDVSLTRDDGPGFTEVWLFEPGTTRMVSLGVLDGGRGSFVVPPRSTWTVTSAWTCLRSGTTAIQRTERPAWREGCSASSPRDADGPRRGRPSVAELEHRGVGLRPDDAIDGQAVDALEVAHRAGGLRPVAAPSTTTGNPIAFNCAWTIRTSGRPGPPARWSTRCARPGTPTGRRRWPSVVLVSVLRSPAAVGSIWPRQSE